MASEIRVDKITSLSGVGTISPSPTGVEIAGITTVSTLKVGSGTTIFPSGGLFTTSSITIDRSDDAALRLISSDNNPDYKLTVTDGRFEIQDITNSFASRFAVDTNGSIKVGSGVTLSPDGDIFTTGVSTSSLLTSLGQSHLIGAVGIGTTIPTSSAHIYSVNPSIKITDYNQETDNKTWLIAAGGYQQLKIQALNDSGGGGGELFNFVRADADVEQFVGNKGGNPWFTINNNTKRVGIGTSIPAADLHVSSGSNTEIRIGDTSTTPAYAKIVYNNNADSSDALSIEVDGDNDISASNIRFKVDGSEKLRILSTGGITFNGDTATTNALSDYEEGTWTPSWGGASVFGTSSYSTNEASYKKIGKLVFVSGYTQITGNTGGSGSWFCTNLPFTSDNGTGYVAPGSCFIHGYDLPDTALWVVPYKNSNTNDMSLYYTRDNNAWAQLQVSQDTAFRIIFSLTYHST